MTEYIRNMIKARVSNITHGDDFIDILTSDQVIEKYVGQGTEHVIKKISDDYYKYRDIFLASGALSVKIQEYILAKVELYTIVSMIGEEIVRVYERPPIMFKMLGIKCLKCGSHQTDTDLLQLGALDEPKVEHTKCLNCAYVSR